MIPLAMLFFFLFGRIIVFLMLVGGLFFLFRRAAYYFDRRDYREDRFRSMYRRKQLKPVWKNDLLLEYPTPLEQAVKKERIIEVQ